MNREDIIELLRSERRELEKKYHVSDHGLFGSYLREEQTEESDLVMGDALKPKIGERILREVAPV